MKITKSGYPNPLHYDNETKRVAGEKLNGIAKELADNIKLVMGTSLGLAQSLEH